MSYQETVRHRGIVEHVGKESCLIRILQTSACSSCSARQLCRSSESKEKLVEVRGHYPTLEVGSTVEIAGSVRQGLRASVLAYIVPLVLMLVVLFIVTSCCGELHGALAALTALALYYVVLRLLKDKLNRRFEFRIESRREP